MIQKIPEPFRSGIGTSNLWKEELSSNGLKVTNCISLHLPETAHEDAYFVVRVGYGCGYFIANEFKFGEPDSVAFEGEAAKFA